MDLSSWEGFLEEVAVERGHIGREGDGEQLETEKTILTNFLSQKIHWNSTLKVITASLEIGIWQTT